MKKFELHPLIVRWGVTLAVLITASLACSQKEYLERRAPESPPAVANVTTNPLPTLQGKGVLETSPGIVFGLTEIKKPVFYKFMPEIGTTWISSQPLVVWQDIEKVAGQYDWKELDEEIVTLQRAGLEATVILLPVVVDADQYVKIKQRIGDKPILEYLRRKESAGMALYPHEPENFRRWRNFVRALVERYDADGQNDAPGLRFPVSNWQVMDQYPSIWFPDVQVYVQLLQATYAEIHAGLPQTKVVLIGLESDLGRKFAFGEGFIEDNEAGVENGIKMSRGQVYDNRQYQKLKKDYEYILREGKDFYDAVDVHLYEPKSTFIPGKLAWIRNELSLMGIDVPLWSMGGGGPFKLRGGQESVFGDKFFGNYSDKENAEFVAKIMTLAMAGGIERSAYPLAENEGMEYYNGPYTNIGLVRPNGTRKPSYYTYIRVKDFVRGSTNLIDLSSGKLRLFEFDVAGKLKYIGWLDAPEKNPTMNMIKLLPGVQIRAQAVVTALDSMEMPLIPEVLQLEASAVPMSETPLLIDEP